MGHTVIVCAISGVEDGREWRLDSTREGQVSSDSWTITIGRGEASVIRLAHDNYASRIHAKLHLRDGQWWLEDVDSRNGTYIPSTHSFLDESRVMGTQPLKEGQLFRVGRTWLRLGRG